MTEKPNLFGTFLNVLLYVTDLRNKVYKDHSKPVKSDTYDNAPSLKSELLRYVPSKDKRRYYHFVAKIHIICDNTKVYIKDAIVSSLILRKQTVPVMGI